MKHTLLAVAAILALGGAVAGCETATPYQALNPQNTQAGGYSENRLNSDRWRVSFSGNTLTSRETVERYLLYRAAELTTSQGFDWFVAADKQTDKTTGAYIDPDYGYGWGPRWRFGGYRGWYGGGWGYAGYGGYGGYGGWGWGGYGGSATVRPYSRYEVFAEVVMGRGPRPADGKALDAHEVVANLGPSIVRPKPQG